MRTEDWQEQCRQLENEEVGFAQFHNKTSQHVKKLVGSMRNRLSPMPEWLTQQDSEQDFWLVWARSSAAARKPTQFSYTLATREAAKRVQKARGVNQHTRTGPENFELRMHDDVEFEQVSNKDPEREILRRECYSMIFKLARTQDERAVVAALYTAGGGLRSTASVLQTDERFAELSVREKSVHCVEEMVLRVVNEMVARIRPSRRKTSENT